MPITFARLLCLANFSRYKSWHCQKALELGLFSVPRADEHTCNSVNQILPLKIILLHIILILFNLYDKYVFLFTYFATKMKCFCIMFNYVTCDKLRSGFFMPLKLFCLFKFRFNLKLIKRFHEHRSEVWINFVPEKPCIRMAILNHGSTFFSQMFLMRLLKAFFTT